MPNTHHDPIYVRIEYVNRDYQPAEALSPVEVLFETGTLTLNVDFPAYEGPTFEEYEKVCDVLISEALLAAGHRATVTLLGDLHSYTCLDEGDQSEYRYTAGYAAGFPEYGREGFNAEGDEYQCGCDDHDVVVRRPFIIVPAESTEITADSIGAAEYIDVLRTYLPTGLGLVPVITDAGDITIWVKERDVTACPLSTVGSFAADIPRVAAALELARSVYCKSPAAMAAAAAEVCRLVAIQTAIDFVEPDLDDDFC